jgi:folate-dependent phosphoribosylglycinamide formyltransferase PurN
MAVDKEPRRLGILFSGGATTAQAVVRACFQEGGELYDMVQPAVAIASKPTAGGIEKLRALGIPVEVVDYKELAPRKKWGSTVAKVYKDYRVAISAQLGLIPRVSQTVLDAVEISMNQHPARLDRQFGGSGEDRRDFGGRWMMGSTAVAAGLIYTCLTGENPWLTSTMHKSTGEVDGGVVFREVHLSIDPLRRLGIDWGYEIMSIASIQDRAEDIQALTKACQAELLPFEHLNAIQTLRDLARGVIAEVGRTSPLISRECIEEFKWAKKLALELFPNG